EKVLTDDEDWMDEVVPVPAVGEPWILSCVQPVASAVNAATVAIHLIFIGWSFLASQAVGGG
ncbi:hypothetical protein RBA12_20580, partial [Mycobacteroides abscessus subsp. massiliense]|uniref:hypothetical protein n=1 Tax=Mycobacteroides abscessus TaxID=36809 RepID=UPI003CF1AB00